MSTYCFKIKFSPYYALYWVVLTLLSSLIAGALPLYWLWRVLLVAMVLGYGAYVLWGEVCLRGKRAVLACECIAKGEWVLMTREGEVSAQLLNGAIATGLVCVLRFKPAKGHRVYKALIFKDALSTDHYRALNVLLRA